MKAHMYALGGEAIKNRADSTALEEDAKQAHEKWWKMVAEGDDELMEKFFPRRKRFQLKIYSGVR